MGQRKRRLHRTEKLKIAFFLQATYTSDLGLYITDIIITLLNITELLIYYTTPYYISNHTQLLLLRLSSCFYTFSTVILMMILYYSGSYRCSTATLMIILLWGTFCTRSYMPSACDYCLKSGRLRFLWGWILRFRTVQVIVGMMMTSLGGHPYIIQL